MLAYICIYTYTYHAPELDELFAELLHHKMRTDLWGYSPDEVHIFPYIYMYVYACIYMYIHIYITRNRIR